MGIVQFKDAKVGQIYVTQGGLISDQQGNVFPWGYERVQLIQKNDQMFSYVFKTPWGTELEVRGDYILYNTPEDMIYSEHKIVGLHERYSIQYIPFDDAVKKGICTIRTPSKIPLLKLLDNNLRQDIVNYFSTPQKITDGAKNFNLTYQRIRWHLKYIQKNGINGITYIISKSVSNDGKNMISPSGNKIPCDIFVLNNMAGDAEAAKIGLEMYEIYKKKRDAENIRQNTTASN